VGKKGSKGRHQVPLAAATAAQPKKVPRVGEHVDFNRSCPVWSFALLDPVGNFGWTHFQKTDLDELLARFRQWEKMTWAQILAEGRKQNHSIDVDKCCRSAQERLKILGLDDREQLLSLRVNSKARVIGILDRATFHILWWDPEHQVCPSTLKGT
jgi:hypothetical protein